MWQGPAFEVEYFPDPASLRAKTFLLAPGRLMTTIFIKRREGSTA